MSILKADVAIVGAGPGGCAAAITAARARRSVVLIDRARFPRDKCCGDGLTTAALRHLEQLGLETTRIPSFTTTDELMIRSGSGRLATLTFRSGGTAAAVCRRVDLDAALVALSRANGVTVVEGDAFEAIERDRDVVALRLASGACVETPQVIAADGAWSPVRRALGGESTRQGSPLHWHAYRAYATGVSADAARSLLVGFDDSLLPGYWWSFPLANGQANVGVCVLRDTRRSGRELAAFAEATLSHPFLNSFLGPTARRQGPLRSWPIPAPLGSLPLSDLAGAVLFVGDAARAADSFTGEGIAQALESGIAAGEAVAQSACPSKAAVAYEHSVESTLARDAAIANWCNRVIGRPLASRSIVSLAAASPRIAKEIGRWLYEDYPRSLPFSPRRWRQHHRSAPLPFATEH